MADTIRKGEVQLVLEQRFEVPKWNQIYDMLIELSDKIRTSGFEPDVLIGMSRGGWLPTRILSDLLENPHIASVGVEFYVGVYETNLEPRLTQPLSISVFDKRILLVDDVVDTGKSAMLTKEHIDNEGAKETKILTLYYKPWSIVVPDFFSKETSDWIVFPWEIKETLRKLKNKYKDDNELVKEAISRLVRDGVAEDLIERFIIQIS